MASAEWEMHFPAAHHSFRTEWMLASESTAAQGLACESPAMRQARLALGFYRRAVQLAGNTARSHFNVALAQDRISKLASQVE